jgi:hypothetical protein
MAAEPWRGELEAQQLLLTKQQSQIDAHGLKISALQKQLGCAPEDDAEVDLPAAEYNRVFAATIALLVYNVASMMVSSFTAGGLEGNLSQVEYLVWPLAWTAIFALVFGTLDSADAGRRSIRLLRIWCVANLICVPLLHWAAGRVGEALFMVFQFSINILYLPWLCGSMIEVLRRRGKLTAQAEFYTAGALKLAGFQTLLLVTGIGQGVNEEETYPRIYATFVFSASLSFTWKYLIAVFDVAAVNSREAVKLRLSCIQVIALALIGAFILAGLAGYVLAQEKEPPERATFAVGYTMMATGFLAIVPVGRLVWVARYHHGRDDSPAASVKPVNALGSLDVLGA